MLKPVPIRQDFTLDEVGARLKVSRIDLEDWLVQGYLRGCMWLPVMSVFEVMHGDLQQLKLTHWEGHALLTRHQCQRLLREEQIIIRHFISQGKQRHFLLPDTSHDYLVRLRDLRISSEEIARFEASYAIHRSNSAKSQPLNENTPFLDQRSFRTIKIDGRPHRFGPVQAALIGLLWEAAERGEPWQNGKRLLRDAGSQDFSISNLFKRKPIWKKLIESDRSGDYRLRENVLIDLG